MFVADEFRDRARVHPLERIEALALAAEPDAFHERIGFLVAERVDEHLAHELVAADAERSLDLELARERGEHFAYFVARHARELGHGTAETLNVLRAHVLEDFRGLALAERQQQDGGAFDAAAFFGGFRHRWPPTPSRPARRAWDPARPCRVPRPPAVRRRARALPPPPARHRRLRSPPGAAPTDAPP